MINKHVICLETINPFNMNEKKTIKDTASLVSSKDHLGFDALINARCFLFT